MKGKIYLIAAAVFAFLSVVFIVLPPAVVLLGLGSLVFLYMGLREYGFEEPVELFKEGVKIAGLGAIGVFVYFLGYIVADYLVRKLIVDSVVVWSVPSTRYHTDNLLFLFCLFEGLWFVVVLFAWYVLGSVAVLGRKLGVKSFEYFRVFVILLLVGSPFLLVSPSYHIVRLGLLVGLFVWYVVGVLKLPDRVGEGGEADVGVLPEKVAFILAGGAALMTTFSYFWCFYALLALLLLYAGFDGFEKRFGRSAEKSLFLRALVVLVTGVVFYAITVLGRMENGYFVSVVEYVAGGYPGGGVVLAFAVISSALVLYSLWLMGEAFAGIGERVGVECFGLLRVVLFVFLVGVVVGGRVGDVLTLGAGACFIWCASKIPSSPVRG